MSKTKRLISLMFHRLIERSYESAFGAFVIVNGFLTLHPNSEVREDLENLVGYGRVVIPVIQIMAGTMKLVGISMQRGNIEAAGIIAVSTMVLIRIIALVSNRQIGLSEVNSIAMCLGIIYANACRLREIVKDIKTVQIISGGDRE